MNATEVTQKALGTTCCFEVDLEDGTSIVLNALVKDVAITCDPIDVPVERGKPQLIPGQQEIEMTIIPVGVTGASDANEQLRDKRIQDASVEELLMAAQIKANSKDEEESEQ